MKVQYAIHKCIYKYFFETYFEVLKWMETGNICSRGGGGPCSSASPGKTSPPPPLTGVARPALTSGDPGRSYLSCSV